MHFEDEFKLSENDMRVLAALAKYGKSIDPGVVRRVMETPAARSNLRRFSPGEVNAMVERIDVPWEGPTPAFTAPPAAPTSATFPPTPCLTPTPSVCR